MAEAVIGNTMWAWVKSLGNKALGCVRLNMP